MTVTIGLVCFVLTYVMFMQFRTVEQTNITEIENLTEKDLREKIASWKAKYEEVNEKLAESNEKLTEYKAKREGNLEASELLDKELLQAKIIAGETDVRGDGVIVRLNNTTDTDEISADTLILLINELNLAGAEAISINDQRIVNMSDIVDIYTTDGAHFILVNKKRVISPYVIKVIGDQKYLESALTTKTVGFIDQFSENATLEKQNDIIIKGYSGEIQMEYTTIKEEK